MMNQYPNASYWARFFAKQRGDKTYESGTACKHCGSLTKHVANSSCVKCNIKRNKHKLSNTALMAPYRTPEKQAAKQTVWRANNPHKHAAQWLRSACRKRGITVESYETMRDAQGNTCAICKLPDERGRLCIDHDHVTGKVRGLICRACNLALGYFKDDSARMRTAAKYIEEFKL
jgi:hypothetical protein